MISRVRQGSRASAALPRKRRHYPIDWRSVIAGAWSRSGRWGAATFAAFYVFCLLGDLLGDGQSIFFIMILTLPFSIAASAAADVLQDTFGLSFEALNWVYWALLGFIGLVESYLIGHGLGAAWRRKG